MAFELSKEQKAVAVAAVMEVLDAAVPAYEVAQLKLFPPDEEEWIRKEVDRMLHEAQLPNGGYREKGWAERMRAIARQQNFDERVTQKARLAAQKWSEVHGWYYTRHPLKARENKEDYEWHRESLQAARKNSNWNMVWFHDMCLKGLPERVADFRMECLFLLRRADGNIDRMVRLHNVLGETTKVIALPAEAYQAPEKFRGWCLNQGNYHWCGNQTHLQLLYPDIGHASAWRTVNQVCQYGWLPVKTGEEPGAKLDGVWIFKDSALANDEWLQPDEHGVYWYKGEGYWMNETGRENKFLQKGPKMQPDFDLRESKLELQAKHDGTPTGLLRAFFQETCDRMKHTVGSYDAYLLIGGMLAYAAGPEIFEDRGEFTGTVVHGTRESGKSTFCGWLMAFFGLLLGRQGLNLRGKTTTATGLAQALDQYSNIPVWVDEFRFSEVDADKISVLHQSYNRVGEAKFNPLMLQRECRTNFLVSGESTTDDAALRGRYMHIQMSAEGREKVNGVTVPHEAWFNKHCRYFFVFFRHLLQHRKEFAELTMKVLATWRETPGISERTKLAFGIPYAAFVAMAHLLEAHEAAELSALRKHTLTAATSAAADIVSETNTNVFWQQVITAFRANAIPNRCFRVTWTNHPYPPGAPNQGAWKSYKLFMDVDSTVDALNEYLAKQRIQMVLRRKDLRDQLSKEAYWIADNKTMRFGPGTESIKCWSFDVDKHEMGYIKCSDEQVQHFVMNSDESDPRKGPLFAIIHAIEKEENRRTP